MNEVVVVGIEITITNALDTILRFVLLGSAAALEEVTYAAQFGDIPMRWYVT